MGLHPMIGVLIRKREETQIGRERHVTMEAKVRIMLSHTKNTWGYQELEESRKDLPLKTLERAWLYKHHDF